MRGVPTAERAAARARPRSLSHLRGLRLGLHRARVLRERRRLQLPERRRHLLAHARVRVLELGDERGAVLDSEAFSEMMFSALEEGGSRHPGLERDMAVAMREAGFTPSELRAAKYPSAELYKAGFGVEELRKAGVSAIELRVDLLTGQLLRPVQREVEMAAPGVQFVHPARRRPVIVQMLRDRLVKGLR